MALGGGVGEEVGVAAGVGVGVGGGVGEGVGVGDEPLISTPEVVVNADSPLSLKARAL
ncbi:MAG: hypothetical protein IIB85_04180 [Chloroflexi bacterium]|nr:hypothetical protein [Chloroflexota bacterium]